MHTDDIEPVMNCPEYGKSCKGTRLSIKGEDLGNWKGCGQLCRADPDCKFWNLASGTYCLMYMDCDPTDDDIGSSSYNIIGSRSCPESMIDATNVPEGNMTYIIYQIEIIRLKSTYIF